MKKTKPMWRKPSLSNLNILNDAQAPNSKSPLPPPPRPQLNHHQRNKPPQQLHEPIAAKREPQSPSPTQAPTQHKPKSALTSPHPLVPIPLPARSSPVRPMLKQSLTMYQPCAPSHFHSAARVTCLVLPTKTIAGRRTELSHQQSNRYARTWPNKGEADCGLSSPRCLRGCQTLVERPV